MKRKIAENLPGGVPEIKLIKSTDVLEGLGLKIEVCDPKDENRRWIVCSASSEPDEYRTLVRFPCGHVENKGTADAKVFGEGLVKGAKAALTGKLNGKALTVKGELPIIERLYRPQKKGQSRSTSYIYKFQLFERSTSYSTSKQPRPIGMIFSNVFDDCYEFVDDELYIALALGETIVEVARHNRKHKIKAPERASQRGPRPKDAGDISRADALDEPGDRGGIEGGPGTF